MNRNQKILLGLLVILALALTYRLANPFRQRTVDRLTYAPAKSVLPEDGEGPVRRQAQVRIDLLQSPPPNSVALHRNLFQYPTEAKAPASDEAAAVQPEPVPLTAAEKIEEQIKRFKTFGSVRNAESDYLFLESGQLVLVVTPGDRIDGRYEILAVTDRSITIAAPELEAPLTIELDEL